MDSSSDKYNEIDYRERGNVSEIHGAAQREKDEPFARDEHQVPAWLYALSAIILLAAGSYLGAFSGGFRSDNLSIYQGRVAELEKPTGDGSSAGGEQLPWIDRHMALGAQVYGNCKACHQATGAGATGVYPPLAGSEWVVNGTERLSMIMLNGVTGPLKVKGELYNGNMQSWKNDLSDEEIAAVMTYIRRSWGNDASVVTKEMVAWAREKHGDKEGAHTAPELLAIAENAMLPGAEVDLTTGEPIGASAEDATPVEETAN